MMKATMAPVDQVLHPSMEDLRRRHDLLHDNSPRRRDKRDSGGGGGGGGSPPNSNSDSNNRDSSLSNDNSDNIDNSNSPDKSNNSDNSDNSDTSSYSNNYSNDGSGDNTNRNTVHLIIASSFSPLDHPSLTQPVFLPSQSALPTTSSVVVIPTTPSSALSIPSSTNVSSSCVAKA